MRASRQGDRPREADHPFRPLPRLRGRRGRRAVSPGPEPTVSEHAFIAACLAKHADVASARQDCVDVDLGACIGLEDAPKSIKTNGFGRPRDCAGIERQIWDGWLNHWCGEALKKVPAATVEKLKAAQRAWIAWRDADCAVDSELHAWPLGDDNEETCLMEDTASRALDLRDMTGNDYENGQWGGRRRLRYACIESNVWTYGQLLCGVSHGSQHPRRGHRAPGSRAGQA